MRFYSTRGAGPVSGARAVIDGMAPDGGLYVPENFPVATREDLARFESMSYPDCAAEILRGFFDEFPLADLARYCRDAYARFDDDRVAPLVCVDKGTFVSELWHGPTSAFKDVALTLLPRLLSAAKSVEGDERKTLILVATSGDTGKAALEGFKDADGIEIVVLYPERGVSPMQKLQMITTGGRNARAIGINGDFDDAQNAAKRIFGDPAMRARIAEKGYALSSANSINFGRLAPQTAYYFSAYADLVAAREVKFGDPINFVVPSGNFGNVLAGHYAREMGLPVKQFIVASNSNNVLTDFFATGEYDARRKLIKTISPSMDILVSGNLERLVYELLGRDGAEVRAKMSALAESGRYRVGEDAMYGAAASFIGYWASEDETRETIRGVFSECDYLVDPHTAVAMRAYEKYMRETYDLTPTVVLSTANPFKFPQDVFQALTGARIEDGFAAIDALRKYANVVPPAGISGLKGLEIRQTLTAELSEIDDAILSALD